MYQCSHVPGMPAWAGVGVKLKSTVVGASVVWLVGVGMVLLLTMDHESVSEVWAWMSTHTHHPSSA